MDKKLKEKWVKALRSGKYKQTAGAFESWGKFCCLGVLCEVAGKRSGRFQFAELALGGARPLYTLARMNDGGAPFPEIADYIEKHL